MSRFERAAARLQRFSDKHDADTALYPSVATPTTGAAFRLRIEALDAKPAAPGVALALAAKLDASHEATLPPGVSILPGSSLTVTSGAFTGHRFEVVPPVQADPLGNRVGLSWKGAT